MNETLSPGQKPVILMLGTRLGIVSGVATHLEQLFQSPLKHKYHFVHFEVGGQGKNENLWNKLKRFLLSPIQLLYKIITLKPDIVHFNTSFDAKAFWRDAVYFWMARLGRKKTVYQIHGGALPHEFFKKSRILTAFLKRLLEGQDAIVVLSHAEQELYYQFCRPAHLRVIPNAINLEPYLKSLEKEFHGKSYNLGYLGSLVSGKGLVETIEALGVLKADKGLPEFHYLVAGTGPLETQLRRRVQELDLQNQVNFLGSLFDSAKTRFWMDVHLFVFPTYAEGLPYTLLESLASGTPVITTPVGAISEVVKSRTHGLFVKPGDTEDLASAIRKLLSNPDQLKTMSMNCVKRAHEFFGIDRLTDQFDELYQFMLRGGPPE